MLRSSSFWLLALCLSVFISSSAAAQEEESVDFSDQITPTCQLIGLIGLPPDGWFNVPIESPVETLSGCQMMRTGESEELLGILRLLSITVAEATPEEEWFPALLDLEIKWLGEMGITLGETLFAREDVPVSGHGFEGGRAIGLKASIEGNNTPQEVHFLGFGRPANKYLVTLFTPARTVDEGTHYGRNTADFGALIRSFQLPSSN